MKLTSLLLWGAAALALPGSATAQFVLNVDKDLGMDDGEITPDGRYGVIRMNAWGGSLLVYDMSTGALVQEQRCDPFGSGPLSGVNEDGVAVTDQRAIVIGNCALIGDLGAVGTPAFLLGQHDVGDRARDVAITPDGTVAAVRGGHVASGGGLFLFDLQTGAMLATAPGDPSDYFSSLYSSDLDSVAVTDQYAVFTSLASSSPPTARVTVFSLKNDSGLPAIAYETVAAAGPDRDLAGAPSDLAVTPDGRYVALRSELEVVLIELARTGPAIVWRAPPQGNPGSLGNATMDTIAVTDTRIATITRWSNGGVGAQVDVFDMAGNQTSDRIAGDPHDLAITPSATRLIVRTSSGAVLYDLEAPPAGGVLPRLDSMSAAASHTGWSAGLDSIEVTDDRAAMLFRTGSTTDVRVFDIGASVLDPVGQFALPDEPTDLALTPDGTRLIVTGLTHLQVIDLRTNTLVLSNNVSPVFPLVPWSDGTVANDTHALTWGVLDYQAGWVATVDLFSQPASYCAAEPSSLGSTARTHATGSARVASNDLSLWATGLPASTPAVLVYGSGQGFAPFGNGFACVSGTVYRFPLGASGTEGYASQAVDLTGPPGTGGAITAGSIWNFQFLYMDGRKRNATDGLTVTFVP